MQGVKIISNQLSGVPHEMQEENQWICLKEEKFGDETTLIPWNPIIKQSIRIDDSNSWFSYNEATKIKSQFKDEVTSLGFITKKGDPFVAIEVYDAIKSNGELSEIASETIAALGGNFYGQIVESTLVIVLRGELEKNLHFKNIKVSYFNNNHVVPVHGTPQWTPKTPWIQPQNLNTVIQNHKKRNSQVDEKSVELPSWYERTNKRLRFLPNPLATYLMKQKDWRICTCNFYVREKGQEEYKIIDENEIKNMIMDYLSPKYLTDQDISNTFNIFKKRVDRDDELLDPERTKGKMNFANGVYDIYTGCFGPYPETYHTAIKLNVDFKHNADCPNFLEYIKKALPEDDLKTTQEMLGYLLSAEIKAEKAFLLYGPGNTGKSVLIETIEKIIGENYVSNVSFQNLGGRFNTAELHGKLLNTYADLPQGKIKDTGIFKALVSGDRIQGEEKGLKPFMFRNTARLLFATNKLPSNLVDQTSGFYRRLIIIPFLNVVPINQIDRDLKEKLLLEKEGIVQWAVKGLQRLINNNYCFTESNHARKLMKEYKKSNNSSFWFIEEFCQFDPNSIESGKTLYETYKARCIETRQVPVSTREFYSQIESQFGSNGVAKQLGSQSRAVEFKGIRLIKANQN